VISGDLLSRLVDEARQETARRRESVRLSTLEEQAGRYAPKDFGAALRGPGLAVIAEMKQRTPSMGVLATDYQPDRIARAYTEAGAAALSVLTHETAFGGSLDHVRIARQHSTLPILRKDFITSSYQVIEARAAGADAVLLIMAALQSDQLAELLRQARSRQLTALVEVHDEHEAAAAVEAGAQVIGVNHRDLRTFKVDLGLTERLRSLVPADRLLVAESGIAGPADARRMRDAGADAILVGELLMRAPDPGACLRELASA
jgi:indole-3-glycerol phosphate synthase